MAILPDFSAAEFHSGTPINNQFFPVELGTLFSYGGSTGDQETGEVTTETNDVLVTSETKDVAGVTTTVVRDTAYENGVLVEDTTDFFAQDTAGNVWYFGELTFSFERDDEGNFIETTTEGSWEAEVNGAHAGIIMQADPGFGAATFQEFAPGVAVDEAITAGVDEEVMIDFGKFGGALNILETSELEPDIAEFNFYAPGVGLVMEREVNHEGELQFENQLLSKQTVGAGDLSIEEPDAEDFLGDGSEMTVTFLEANTETDDAIGAYTVDADTGEFQAGRILFTGTEDLEAGSRASIDVANGQALGLFVVPNAGDSGVDLSEFTDGGLFFTNFVTLQRATLGDGLAPLVTDSDGDVLPLVAVHALDDNPEDGVNFLNLTAGVQAVELETSEDAGAGETVLGFEDRLSTDPAFDGDFNDLLVAVSTDTPNTEVDLLM